MSAAEVLPTVPTPETGPAASGRRSGSFWGDVLRRVRRNPAAWIGGVVIAAFVLVALLAPWLAPYPELATPGREYLRPTSLPGIGEIPEFPLGIDRFGGDVVSKLIWGAQASLLIGIASTFFGLLGGMVLGALAGAFGGWVDTIVMRVVDILLAFPGILLNIAIVALVARPGVGTMVIALAVNGWVRYARLARGQVLSMRELEYVVAAKAIGARPSAIMFKHILPNMLSPVVVMMSLSFGGVIAVEASLSFLGLGPQLDYSWGSLLDQGTTFSWITPRLAIVPGIAIMMVVLGSNLLGDGLRDYYDPKSKK